MPPPMMQPTALIADDVEEMRELLQKTLETMGVKVIGQVNNGESALEAIEVMKPDMCFLDIDMPGMTGIELLDKLTLHRAMIYPVIISGHSTVANVRTCIAKGAKGFVVKPYTFDKIKHIVDKFHQANFRLKQA